MDLFIKYQHFYCQNEHQNSRFNYINILHKTNAQFAKLPEIDTFRLTAVINDNRRKKNFILSAGNWEYVAFFN